MYVSRKGEASKEGARDAGGGHVIRAGEDMQTPDFRSPIKPKIQPTPGHQMRCRFLLPIPIRDGSSPVREGVLAQSPPLLEGVPASCNTWSEHSWCQKIQVNRDTLELLAAQQKSRINEEMQVSGCSLSIHLSNNIVWNTSYPIKSLWSQGWPSKVLTPHVLQAFLKRT